MAKYRRIVQTGNLIEVFDYEKEPAAVVLGAAFKGGKSVKRRRGRGLSVRSASSVNRAIQSFWRIVRGNLSNSPPALLTLTMRDILALGDAWKCYTTFGQKLKRVFGKDVAWIAVAEFQKRGSVHFHVLIWGLPAELPCILGGKYVDKSGKKHRQHLCPAERKCERSLRLLAGFWSHGFLDIAETDGAPKLATYLSKYMSKSMRDERLFGSHSFSASRNIVRPVRYATSTALDFISKEFGIEDVDNYPSYEREYATMWLGRCKYRRFDGRELSTP